MKNSRLHILIVAILASEFAAASSARAATDQWTGISSANWNNANNWSLSPSATQVVPTSADTVLFSTGSGSATNLNTNNDIPGGASILGISNTLAPNGDITISGNPLTIGSGGIVYGQSGSAATRSMTINSNITVGASQPWTMGGTGLSLTIGANSANTVTLNGNTVTLRHVGNVEFMVLNSSIVDGSSAGAVSILASSGTSKTQMRFLGTNTYSNGTSSTGANQVLQLGSNSAVGNGPLGTGTVTLVSGNTYFEAYGANRSIDNNFTIGSGATLTETTSTGQTNRSLTLNGAISSPTGNRTILVDTQSSSAGSGDLIFNGTITLGSSGVAGGSLTTGVTATSVFTPGKIFYNGNIVEAAGVTSGASLSVVNGNPGTNAAFISQVVLNGQNTYSGGTTFGAGSGIIYLGSSSAGPAGSPTSGPLGKGSLTFNNGGNTPRLEAIGNQTVGNNLVMTSAGIVQGSDNLTLSGTISGASGLTKNGTGTLTLTGTNSFSGNMTVNNGTLSVPSIAATGTNQPLGTSAAAISVGGATTAGTLEYTGAGATTLSRQITVGAGGATIRATAATGTGLTLNAATAVSAGANAVTFDGAGNTTVSTPITGTTATLTKTGNGTLNLNATNTYTGATTVNGGTLGGTGSVAGAVVVNSGGTLSPGASIESLGSGAVTFNTGSTFKYEIDTIANMADLLNATGSSLSIASGVSLLALDLNPNPNAISGPTYKYTMIAYSNGGNPTYDPGFFATYPELSVVTFTPGGKQFRIRYRDTAPGNNFASETPVGANNRFVTLTAVPELGSFITMGLVGCCAIGAVRLGRRFGLKALTL